MKQRQQQKKVLSEEESIAIVQDDHEKHHCGQNETLSRLSSLYKIKNLREKTREVLRNCPVCVGVGH